jgi:methanogenic corrinoid protein MtbC1
MEATIKVLHELNESICVLVGGAPVTQEYADKIGVNGYSADPQSFYEYFYWIHG